MSNNPLERVSQRLRRTDMVQLLTLLFTLMIFVLLTRWPSQGGRNDAWFGVTQARIMVLALLALGYGSVSSRQHREEQLDTAGAILVFSFLSIPFDVAAYAASFPATPLWWPLLLSPIDSLAFFGLGLLLGKLLTKLRLQTLLPVAIPGLLIAFIALDVRFGMTLLNPMTASVVLTYKHLAIMAIIATICSYLLIGRRARRQGGES